MRLCRRQTVIAAFGSVFLFSFTTSCWTYMILLVHRNWFTKNNDFDETKIMTKSRSAEDRQFQVPFHPFDAGHSKLLVIVAYQRSGSTLFGRLFNVNPDVFYIYEPLDSLYSSLYGTKQGWNVPTDITNYSNGTERVLPQVELEMVSEFLRFLLLCDVKSLPTEALIHRFMFILGNESSAMIPYIKCVRSKQYRIALRNYYLSIPWNYCGERFGLKSEERLTECRQLLTSEKYRKEQAKHSKINLFNRYLWNAKNVRKIMEGNCVSHLSKACNDRSLRVTKVVRAAMESMRSLLQNISNFRVIHLIRDPRAVVLSRKNFESSGGLYTAVDRNGSMVLEARLYCKTVVNDIKTRMELEKLHPGKIYTIVYEDMVQNFQTYAENVYRFMNSSISRETSSWIRKIDSNRLNSTLIAHRWKKVLTYEEHYEISNECKEFFQLTDYEWSN